MKKRRIFFLLFANLLLIYSVIPERAFARSVLDVIYYHYRATTLSHVIPNFDLIPKAPESSNLEWTDVKKSDVFFTQQPIVFPTAPLETFANASDFRIYFEALEKYYQSLLPNKRYKARAAYYHDLAAAAQAIQTQRLYTERSAKKRPSSTKYFSQIHD